jgi:hypothetical protein
MRSKFPAVRRTFDRQNRPRLDVIFAALLEYAENSDVHLPSAEELVHRIELATGSPVSRQNVRNLLHRLRGKLQTTLGVELEHYPTDGFRSQPLRRLPSVAQA